MSRLGPRLLVITLAGLIIVALVVIIVPRRRCPNMGLGLAYYHDFYFSRLGHVHHNNTHTNRSKIAVTVVGEQVVTDLPQIYVTRKSRVQQKCSHSPEFTDLTRSVVVVIPQYSILICSTLQVIERAWGNQVSIDSEGRSPSPNSRETPENDNQNNDFRLLKQYEADQIRSMLNSYYKVLFVSHPIFHQYEAYAAEEGAGGSSGTYPSYIRSVVRGDIHVSNFTELCLPCHVKYDLIEQAETLKQGVEYLSKTVWPDAKDAISLDEVRLLLQRSREHSDQLNSTLVEQLKSMYRVDYEMFGYH